MLVVELDAHVLRADRAICDIAGYDVKRLAGPAPFLFVHPDGRRPSALGEVRQGEAAVHGVEVAVLERERTRLARR
jgi:hypothetical protein